MSSTTPVEPLILQLSSIAFEISNRPLVLKASVCAAQGVVTEAVEPEFYIPPDFTPSTDLEVGPSNVLLISAPAAVGKSTLARYLHYRLASNKKIVLYIPLADQPIGGNFFSGLLGSIFPGNTQEEIIDAMLDGRLLVLLDGYDEVSMSPEQIGKNKLMAEEIAGLFARRNAELGRTRFSYVSIVFLFRSVFDQFRIFDPFVLAHKISISFFDEKQQKAFLSGYLRRRNVEVAKFVPQVLEIFSQAALLDDAETRAFFGHAIVLSAFGDYILEALESSDSSVFGVLSGMLGGGSAASRTVEVLLGVIKRILSREQTKFPNSRFKTQIPGFEGYTSEIQEDLLCEFARLGLSRGGIPNRTAIQIRAGKIATATLDSFDEFQALDTEERRRIYDDYVDELANRFEHHPLIDTFIRNGANDYRFRNVIYHDYYLARQLYSMGDNAPLDFRGAGPSSFYLAHFFLALLPNRTLGRYSRMLFNIVQSLALSSNGDDCDFIVDWCTEEKVWKARAEGQNISSMDPFVIQGEVLEIQLPDSGTLQNVIVEGNSDCTSVLIFVPPEQQFSAQISLHNITLHCDVVEMRAWELEFERVEISANELSIADQVHKIRGIDDLEFIPLKDGKIPQVSRSILKRWPKFEDCGQPRSDALDEFKSKLRKVLGIFRRHGRNEYAAYHKRYENYSLSKGKDVTAVKLDGVLRMHGILRKGGAMIVLEQSKLESLGVFYKSQNDIHYAGDGWRSIFDEWKGA